MQVKRVTVADDLADIADQCNSDKWGDDSELLSYSEATVRAFLGDPSNVLVVAFDDTTIAGVAIGYALLHPSGNKTMYIDELDTHPNYRRQGVATMIMEKFQNIARETNCSEVWLSSSKDNAGAHAFYKSLHPAEEKDATIYGYAQDRKV